MQFGRFEIQLNGNMSNVVQRSGVSPAEVEILKAMHGDYSVHPLYIEKEKNTSNTDELDRLLHQRFTSKKGKEVFKEVFPGSRPQLPVNFSDIGLHNIPWKKDEQAEELKESGLSEDEAAAIVAQINKQAEEEEAELKQIEEERRKALEEEEKNEDNKVEPSPKKNDKKAAKSKKGAGNKSTKAGSRKKGSKSSKSKTPTEEVSESETEFEPTIELEYNDDE